MAGRAAQLAEGRTPQMVVGLGNWFYPRSRENVGIAVIDEIGRQAKLQWKFSNAFCADFGTINRMVFVRPKAYQHKFMNRTVFPASEVLDIAPENIILVAANPEVPFGRVLSRSSDVEWDDLDLRVPSVESLFSFFNRIKVKPTRHYVGIAPVQGPMSIVRTPLQAMARNERIREQQIDLFLKNVFTDDEQVLMKPTVEKLASTLVQIAGGASGSTRLHSL